MKRFWSIWCAFAFHAVVFTMVWGGAGSPEPSDGRSFGNHADVAVVTPLPSENQERGDWVVEEVEELEEVERADERDEDPSLTGREAPAEPDAYGLRPEVERQRGRAPPAGEPALPHVPSRYAAAHPSRGPPPYLRA